MKLYELSRDMQKLQEMMENDELEFSVVEDTLESLQLEFEDKAQNIAFLIKNIEADIKVLKEEELRLKARRDSLNNKISNLKAYLYENMRTADLKKVKTALVTVSVQKNPPSLDIVNEDMLPIRFFIEQEPKIDRKAILEAIKSGEIVEGATIKQSEGIRIR